MLVNSCPDPYGASREHARDGRRRRLRSDGPGLPGQARLASIDTRGSALSSAILYLAIVAIWAVVLVPRWLRPRSALPQPAEQQFAEQPAEPQPVPPQPAEPLTAPPGDAQWEEQAEPAPGETPAATDEPVAEPVPASPSPATRRADILQARRRMLGMIVALTIGAVGLAVTGVAASLVIFPPAMLLAGFLVLLREAARSDTERARRATPIRRTTAAVAGQEPGPFRDDVEAGRYQVPAESAPAVAEATDAEPPPDAEVIDISARVSDQVYDQYSDAAERAVGD
jgi:hypothetical protein